VRSQTGVSGEAVRWPAMRTWRSSPAGSRWRSVARPRRPSPPDQRRLVRVDGLIVTNPRACVPRGAAVTIAAPPTPPRGARKLAAGLDAFADPVAGRVALDLGAAAGGFTHALLAAGARRVYAVDAGHGQLLGSLRADGRVVNLERTNLADLTGVLVPMSSRSSPSICRTSPWRGPRRRSRPWPSPPPTWSPWSSRCTSSGWPVPGRP
jgi:hypothetical protein